LAEQAREPGAPWRECRPQLRVDKHVLILCAFKGPLLTLRSGRSQPCNSAERVPPLRAILLRARGRARGLAVSTYCSLWHAVLTSATCCLGAQVDNVHVEVEVQRSEKRCESVICICCG
jgi:hypothetical protein